MEPSSNRHWLRAEDSSPWLAEFDKQMLRGKQALLYGNVADEYLFNGEYVTLRSFLNGYFAQAGYPLVLHYDLVDGIEVAEPEMRTQLDQVRRAAGAPFASARPASVPAPAAPLGGFGGGPAIPAPMSRRIGEGAPPAGTSARPVGSASGVPAPGPSSAGDRLPYQPDQALPILRNVLRQNQTPVAVALSFSDKLVGDPQHQNRDELSILVLIKKMIQEAALLDGQNVGTARFRRNAVVILAEQLSGIPTWIFQDNPLLSIIPIPRPRREERIAFANRFLDSFHQEPNLTGSERNKVIELFADLTDGLTTHDLHAIRRTSKRESVSVAKPKVLIDYYKFGIKQDPWAKLNKDRVQSARRTLGARVIGQEHAIEAVVDMLVSARVGLGLADGGKAGKPKGVFFFVGPTGVGKTELAKAITELIFGDESAFARFDMSEYALEHAAEKLTGSPPGFVGYEEGGQLTNRVLDKPFSLLLFDEIEKAHGKIMDKFLQILEDGRLTDSRGQTADFSQSVIIFTSNIGSDKLATVPAGDDEGLPLYSKIEEHYKKEVRAHFTKPTSENGLGRPELLNRLGDNVLVFDVLRPKCIEEIVKKFERSLMRNVQERFGVVLNFSGNDVAELVKRLMRTNPENFQMGGRRVRTLFEDLVLKPLNRHVFERFENEVPRGTEFRVTVLPQADEISIQ